MRKLTHTATTARDTLSNRWKQFERLLRWRISRQLWMNAIPATIPLIDELLGEAAIRLAEAVDAMHGLEERQWVREAFRLTVNAVNSWANRDNSCKSRIVALAARETSYIPDNSNDPTATAERHERAEIVRNVFDLLEGDDQQMITACCMEDEPPSAVARAYGDSTPAIRRHVGQLLERLAGDLPDEFGEHEPSDFYGAERRPLEADDPIVGRIRQRYAECVPTEELARLYDISRRRVWDICFGYRKFEHLGPVDRDKGPGKPKLNAEELAEARRLRRRGETVLSLAERFNVSERTMSSAVNKSRHYANR